MLFVKIFVFLESLIASIIPHRLIVIDTETTGVKPESDEILQLSIISGHRRILFDHYIKPVSHAEWKGAQKVNRIKPSNVRFRPTMDVYAPLVQAIIKNAKIIVGYNTEFDLMILKNAGIHVDGRYIDVMREDSDRRNGAKWRKLGETAAAYGYFLVPHDSLEDCEATLHIYKRMFPEKNFLVKIWNLFIYILPIIVFALIHIYCGQKGFSQASGFVLLAMICYQFGMVRGALGGLVLGFLCFSNNWLSVLVFVLSGICLCILYRFASIFRFVPLKVVYVAICTVAVPYFMVYLSTIGVSVFNIFSDEIIGYMLAWSPLYMFLKQPIRRFL